MSTMYSILVLIIYVLCELELNEASSYDPLVVTLKRTLFRVKVQLPYKAEELNGKIIYPEIKPEEKNEKGEKQGEKIQDGENQDEKIPEGENRNEANHGEENQDAVNQNEKNYDGENQDEKNEKEKNHLYLCRPLSPNIRKIIIDSSDSYPQDEYCLIDYSTVKYFQRTGSCVLETKPVFTKNLVHRPDKRENCGTSVNHDLHYFGFNYCQITNIIQDITFSRIISQVLSIYEICFDTVNSKPFWTRHRIKTGFMFKDPSGFPSQRSESYAKLSTEAYKSKFVLRSEDVFEKQAKEYENQAENTPYRMIPQQLVPQDDIAIQLWKTTTQHYVNTASLWEKLVPVMKSINDGIRKAAIKVNLDSYNEQTNTYDDLVIYTTTYSHLSKRLRFVNAVNLLHKEPFGLNIWCKFVHYANKNQGIMIFLHNTPENPPKNTAPATDHVRGEYSKQSTTDDNYKNTAESLKANKIIYSKPQCERTVTCDFPLWFIGQLERGFSNDLYNFAYCCEVDKDKVKKLFGIELQNEIALLDIDNMITNTLPKS